MPTYLYLYRGPATPTDDITPEQGAEQMAAWNAWRDAAGDAVADFGAPFGARTAVTDDGRATGTTELGGYSLVTADSLDAAVALTQKHPFLSEGKGRFAIEVFELVPM